MVIYLKRDSKRRLIYAAIFIALAIAAGEIANIFSRYDEINLKIIESVERGSLLQAELGAIKSMSLERRLVFKGDGVRDPYREYTYYVIGSSGRATVKLRVVGERYDDIKIIEIR